MNLKDKLYQLDKPAIKTQVQLPVSRGNGIEKFVDGEYVETPFGQCFVTKKRYTPGDFIGKVDFFSLRNKPARLFQFIGKDKSLDGLDIQKSLFLDTETTGLAGGAGTYVILIGIGFFTEDGFEIEQYFMQDYHQELAMLHCLHQRLKSADSFVTYNGKSYDVPLLKTRFTLSRMETSNFPTRHLDLLHAARRLWRYDLETYDLNSVEYKMLGVKRINDIPGALIPHLYFEYLQTKSAEPLQGIFTHNLQDILSLVGIATRACELFESVTTGEATLGEMICIARIYEDLKLFIESAAIYENALKKITDPNWTNEVATHLSWCFKRMRQWEQAKNVWEQMLSNGKKTIFPYVELAKYYEHIARDFLQAQKKVQEALQWIELQELIQSNPENAEHRKELVHRLARIRRKLAEVCVEDMG